MISFTSSGCSISCWHCCCCFYCWCWWWFIRRQLLYFIKFSPKRPSCFSQVIVLMSTTECPELSEINPKNFLSRSRSPPRGLWQGARASRRGNGVTWVNYRVLPSDGPLCIGAHTCPWLGTYVMRSYCDNIWWLSMFIQHLEELFRAKLISMPTLKLFLSFFLI